MSFEIGRVTSQGLAPVAPVQPPQGGGFGAALAGAAARRDVASIGVPATPPPDVMQEVQAAGRRAAELAAQHRELHFEKDPASGRVIVEVRDLDGHVLRTIPPSRALEVMSGAAL